MGVMKTPGVYIVEKNAFPNSVVEVATAVPAFIGYTERADNKGKSLDKKPWRISSMAEFRNYFGAGPKPLFTVTKKTNVPKDKTVVAKDKTDVPEDKTDVAPKKTVVAAGKTDVGPKKKGKELETDFFLEGEEYLVSHKTGKYLLYYCMLHFFQNGGGVCYVVSVGNYENDDIEADKLKEGIELLVKEQEPTMVVIPDAVLLDKDNCIGVQEASLAHCGGKMKNRVAILDIWDGFKDIKDPPENCVDVFRNALGINYLDYAAAYYPWVHTTIVQDNDLSYENIEEGGKLQQLLREELKLPAKKDDKTPVKTVQQMVAVDQITQDWSTAVDAKGKTLSDEDILTSKILLNKSLIAISPLYNVILTEIKNTLNLLPPAAAMAGVYTMVDNGRGVWKAPANVSLNAVVSPAVNITHDDQEDLNVTTQGKSINAIRTFIGEGTLVWGARTLDGNSLDWRYISVRRTMIMLEESIRLATKAYVFESNDAQTWVTIRSMIRNFLTGIWKRGGLAGASPEEAFSVFVGLGETMTAVDILEGILKVTVLVAITRPAEFIEITFQQQMQKS